MRTDFRQANLEALCDIYNHTLPERYSIDAWLLQQHTVDSPIFDWGASCIEPGKAFIAIKKSPASLYSGPSPDSAHICILGYQDPTVMLDLVREAKKCLLDRGIAKLHFGMDSGHFFPGCPVDSPSLKDFLLIGGFEEGGESHDLERDLIDYEIPVPLPEGFEYRPVQTEDIPLVDHFLRAEFPGRWHYDVLKKMEDEKDPTVIFGLFRGDECKGFAMTQLEGCVTQTGGAVWKRDLGPNWCSLGPIGISKDVRGRGCGTALLGAGLAHLKGLGGRRCIIDWTGLVEFYGSHGFEVTRTYKSFSLDFEHIPEV